MPITPVDNDNVNWEQLLAFASSKVSALCRLPSFYTIADILATQANDDTGAVQDGQFDELFAAFTNSSALAVPEIETSADGDNTALSDSQVKVIQAALNLEPAATSSPPVDLCLSLSSEVKSIWEDLFGAEDPLSPTVSEDPQMAKLDKLLGDLSDSRGSTPALDDSVEITCAALTAYE